MKRFLLVSGLAAGIFLFLPERAEAGQLHINLLDLPDIAHGAGYALGAVILSVNAAAAKVRVLVERVWTGPGITPNGFEYTGVTENGEETVYVNPRKYEEGREYDLDIYTGVEWTDPNISPMDYRVRGALELDSVNPGDRVTVVEGWGKELVPLNPSMERKLEIFFSKHGVDQYRDTASVQDLKEDFSDPDLRKLAREELEKKDALTPEVFITAAASAPDVFTFIIGHLRSLSETEQTEFFETAARILSESRNIKLIGDFLLLLRNTYGTDPDEKIKWKLIRLLEAEGTPEANLLLEMYR
jgi:hypothetical protein